jgi:[ribosomal protein S18]-alanine N-acetyltransferase
MIKLLKRDPIHVPLQVIPYQRRHRQAVRELLFRHEHTHTHLDWQETDAWLDSEEGPVRLAWQGARLVGVIGASEPLDGTCWLRLLAVHDAAHTDGVLGALWGDMRLELAHLGVATASLLMLRDWLFDHAGALGFRFTEEIVTLRRSDQPAPPEMLPPGVMLRLARPDDLEPVVRVDHAAFKAPWQMTRRELHQAERMSAYYTVALVDGAIMGYQICTVYFEGAHLARLAVDPRAQGMGVGAALLNGALRHFARRGLNVMTVNTQHSNDRSQHLYLRAGFRHNGYNMPVWMAEV